MHTKQSDKVLQIIILSTLVITSLIISPYLTYDATNPPKFLTLSCGAFTGLFFLLSVIYKERHISNFAYYKVPIILALSFVIISGIAVIRSNIKIENQLYGYFGRNNGFITYLCLVLLFLSAVYSSEKNFFKRIFVSTALVGFISLLYAIIQILDLDPIPWKKSENWITSFYANPNFFSSFLGIFLGAVFGYMVVNLQKKILLPISLGVLIIGIYVLIENGSYQGMVILFFSILAHISIKLGQDPSRKRWSKYFNFGLMFTGIWALLDVFQLTPGNSLLYKSSVASREFYWQAAFSILRQNPFSGIGFDGYRNYFERNRTLASTFDVDAKNVTDSSHSIPLDIGVNGGILLLIIYLTIQCITIIAIYRILKHRQYPNIYFPIVVIIWLGYTIQSLISINHLGLALLGWITSGAILGYSSREKYAKSHIKDQLASVRQVKDRFSLKTRFSFAAIVGFCVGLTLASPLFLVENKSLKAIQQRDQIQIEAVGNQWPRDTLRMSILAQVLYYDLGLKYEARRMLMQASKYDSESSIPIKLLYELKLFYPEEEAQIVSRIKYLDPYYFKIRERLNEDF